MTWGQLAEKIARMPPQRREREVCLVEAYNEPARRVVALEVVEAEEPVYCGIGIGSELVLAEGDLYLREAERS